MTSKDRPMLDSEEIEITSAMIAAGASELLELEGVVATATQVRRVFLAMWNALPSNFGTRRGAFGTEAR